MSVTQSRMQCLQVWGGSRTADASVSTTGLDVWLYSKPYGDHEEGGDVYYLSSCSSGRITRLLLADVRGHGETVAGLAASLRRVMQRHINHINQKTLVRSVNREFVSVGDASTFATGVIATFFGPTGTFTLSNAGHPSPLWFDSTRQEWRALEQPSSSTAPTDVPLGIFERADYGRIDLQLSSDDLVLCFTDGLEDCVDEWGEVLGRDGVLRVVSELDHREPERIISTILDRVRSMAAGNLSHDDVTIALIRPNGAAPSLRDNLMAPFRYLRHLAGSTPAT